MQNGKWFNEKRTNKKFRIYRGFRMGDRRVRKVGIIRANQITKNQRCLVGS